MKHGGVDSGGSDATFRFSGLRIASLARRLVEEVQVEGGAVGNVEGEGWEGVEIEIERRRGVDSAPDELGT